MLKKKCDICKKEFEGYTEKQLDHIIDLHQTSRLCKLIKAKKEDSKK